MTADLLSAIAGLTGTDLKDLGLLTALPEDRRVPGKPMYKIDAGVAIPFNVYWGYWYGPDGTPFPLKQDVNTSQMYGLVSRDQIGRCIVLNGLRVIFFEEALHTSCKVIEVSDTSGVKMRTASVQEAVDFLCKLKPEWRGFIAQSVLVNLPSLKAREDEVRWGQNVRRRLLEVTSVPGASEEILDMDVEADPVDEATLVPLPAAPPPPGASFPAWPSTTSEDTADGSLPVAFSDEVLSPPTKQDRPVVVQLKVVSDVQGVPLNRLSDAQLSRIKNHAHYWMRPLGHRTDDVHIVSHCEGGVELTLGLKIGGTTGLDSNNRKNWVENVLNSLKVQIENGTPPKRDGKITINPVVGVSVLSARCAYP
jgi:hypothetical protein